MRLAVLAMAALALAACSRQQPSRSATHSGINRSLQDALVSETAKQPWRNPGPKGCSDDFPQACRVGARMVCVAAADDCGRAAQSLAKGGGPAG